MAQVLPLPPVLIAGGVLRGRALTHGPTIPVMSGIAASRATVSDTPTRLPKAIPYSRVQSDSRRGHTVVGYDQRVDAAMVAMVAADRHVQSSEQARDNDGTEEGCGPPYVATARTECK